MANYPVNFSLSVTQEMADQLNKIARTEHDPSLSTTQLIRDIIIAEYLGDMICPFCGKKGFDNPGLKWHILNRCKVFSAIENL